MRRSGGRSGAPAVVCAIDRSGDRTGGRSAGRELRRLVGARPSRPFVRSVRLAGTAPAPHWPAMCWYYTLALPCANALQLWPGPALQRHWPAMTQVWYCTGSRRVLCWYYPGTVPILSWFCPGSLLGLPRGEHVVHIGLPDPGFGSAPFGVTEPKFCIEFCGWRRCSSTSKLRRSGSGRKKNFGRVLFGPA